MLVALLAMYVPAVQFVQTAQWLTLVREENSPAAQGAQVRSLAADPFAVTLLPAVQFRHFEQTLALARDENLPASQGAQVRSLIAVPFAATKLPSLQLRHEEHARSEVSDPAALT